MRAGRVVLAAGLGALLGATLALGAARLVVPVYQAAAEVEFVQARGTLPLSDAARDARIDGFVEAARSVPVATAALARIDGAPHGRLAVGGLLAVLDHVRAERIGATALVRIDVRDAHPARAALLADAFAGALVARSLADRVAAIGPADAALDQDLAARRAAVDRADQALAGYRSLMVQSAGDTPATGDGDVAAFRTTANAAWGEAAAAAARAGAAGHDVVVSGSTIGQNGTASLADLRGQRAEVARRAAVLAERFDPAYPLLAAATTELATLDRAIGAELGSLSRSAHADAAAASARAAALERGLNAAERRHARGLAAEADLARLTRDADAARDAYRLLQDGFVQRATERSMARPELRLAVSPSVPLEPVSPDRLLLALFGGMALGVLAALGTIWLERRRLAALRFVA